ncbi:RimJ/RimL family protein N-acetyltransferase [Inhella inkyongensis]|uniref:RimJ/RimL family protein N-acetyltransferase n=1 Tax=Inhella inkyongensis TaxID=392593 RepID=A0A840S2P0_9BURK|nr:GNAT family N-acetyltransferase [Inhella inkyongensis]MBB5203802.1 RimJ/RimL family protein N-acetyltransferase [Inhella inkyongensis]
MSTSTAFPTLQTARLLLREITADDARALFEIHGDPVAMRYFGSLQRDLDSMRAVIQRFAQWRQLPAPGTRWGIALQCGGPLIGSCGLFSWNRDQRRCMLGYELHPAQQGQGLMQEALNAVLPWGFAQMDGLHRIEALIHPDNQSSNRLIQCLGGSVKPPAPAPRLFGMRAKARAAAQAGGLSKACNAGHRPKSLWPARVCERTGRLGRWRARLSDGESDLRAPPTIRPVLSQTRAARGFADPPLGFRAEGLQRDVIWCEDRPMSLTMWSRLKTDPALPN